MMIKTRTYTGKQYLVHLQYCKDKWLTPVSHATFSNRIGRWWDMKDYIFTPNSWHWWDRVWVNSVRNKWKKYLEDGWNYMTYSAYRNKFNKLST